MTTPQRQTLAGRLVDPASRPPGPPPHPRPRPQRALPARRRRRADRRARSGTRRRPPVNLGFVLDRSGSMGGHNKLGLAKQAVARGDPPARRTRTGSRSSPTTTRSTSSCPAPRPRRAPRAAADAPALRRAARAAPTCTAAGSPAASRSRPASQPEGVNRVLLLTDGLANVGVTDHDELGAPAPTTSVGAGVTTSTFGVGTDFDESLLQAMADTGGGHFYFIGDVAQMRDHITSEVGETLEVVAREVVLELTLPESVRVEPLSPFRVEQRPRPGPGLPRRHGVRAGPLGRAAGDLRLRRGRPRDRRASSGSRTATAPSTLARPALEPVTVAWRVRGPRRERRPAARPRRGPGRGPAVRGAGQAGGRAPQPRGPLRGGREPARPGPQPASGVRRRTTSSCRKVAQELHAEAPAFAAPMLEMDRKQRPLQASVMSRSARSMDGKSIRRSSGTDHPRTARVRPDRPARRLILPGRTLPEAGPCPGSAAQRPPPCPGRMPAVTLRPTTLDDKPAPRKIPM